MADRLKPDACCALCESWSGGIGDAAGECRRAVPVFLVGTDRRWPQVASDEWCGEFVEDAAVAAAIAARALP